MTKVISTISAIMVFNDKFSMFLKYKTINPCVILTEMGDGHEQSTTEWTTLKILLNSPLIILTSNTLTFLLITQLKITQHLCHKH